MGKTKYATNWPTREIQDVAIGLLTAVKVE